MQEKQDACRSVQTSTLVSHSLRAPNLLLASLTVDQAKLSSLDAGRTDCKGEAAESEYD